ALISVSLAEIMLGRYAEAEANLTRALALIPAASAQHQTAAANAFSSLGLLCFTHGRYLEAEQWLRRAAASHGSGPDFARDLANLAKVFIATGRYDKAEAACSQALEGRAGWAKNGLD